MTSPTILAFDTSAAHCAAALLSGDRILASAHEDMARGQAERLMVLLDEILSAGGAGYGDLDAIGVGVGPGNFTGIRISVAAARGLALGLQRPAIGVGVHEAMALGSRGHATTLTDARQGQTFRQTHLDGIATGAVRLFQADDPGPVEPVIGHGPSETAPAHPLAHAIARIARARLADGPQPRPAPLYIRPADAAPARAVPPVR